MHILKIGEMSLQFSDYAGILSKSKERGLTFGLHYCDIPQKHLMVKLWQYNYYACINFESGRNAA
jgi:hypothetical protein